MNAEINTKSLQDKINGLNKQAWVIRVSDSGQAQVISKEAVDLAEDIDYTKGKAEGLRTLGFSYIRLSKYTEALEAKRKLKLYALFSALGGFLILAIILYRNNRNKAKANALLQEQK
jgi:hypothetical protein